MRLMRLVPIYQEPNTSKKHYRHKIWPYLLRKVVIDRPNQVWCADITYIPMPRGLKLPGMAQAPLGTLLRNALPGSGGRPDRTGGTLLGGFFHLIRRNIFCAAS